MIASGSRAWWATSSDGSNTWSQTETWYNYVEDGSPSKQGLFGTSYNVNAIGYAQIADVIQFKSSGSSIFNHSTIVTSVTGNHGSQTASSVYITGHTAHDHNVPVSYYLSKNPNFRVVVVPFTYY